MNDKNQSMIEKAYELMKKKKQPQKISKITEEVFQTKGLKIEENEDAVIQFQVDFMLCGLFVFCGEDKSGSKLWDLKTRQPSSLLDKDGHYIDDLYDDDEDVKMHQLSGDGDYLQEEKDLEDSDDEDEEKENDIDEIEEELNEYSPKEYEADADEDDEDSYDDDDE